MRTVMLAWKGKATDISMFAGSSSPDQLRGIGDSAMRCLHVPYLGNYRETDLLTSKYVQSKLVILSVWYIIGK